ncbi:MAG: transketolase [Verrucomicrobiae bacterium]|nr:transketolase [Verrucomicrobiae bacterium]
MSPQAIRRIILEQSRRANVGHIGSALCIADLIAVLYGEILRVERPDDPGRDRFVLSKGHAALALYAAIRLKGWIGDADLNTFCGDASCLGVHPELGVPGVDFATGSLGQGLSMAAGSALAAKLHGSDRRVFCLVSDAECNEGAIWEAAGFAAHHRLGNLTAILDNDGQQAFGFTRDVLNLAPLSEKWRAFGWSVREIDGHDAGAITEALRSRDPEKPTLVLANTVFGKGVSFMERQIKWHYWPMSEEDYAKAMKEVGS